MQSKQPVRQTSPSCEALLRDIEHVMSLYENEIGVAAARTRQMIERYGPIEALSRLAISADLQKGFKVLRDRNQLDSTFEALIAHHAGLFRNDVVAAANWRLQNPHLLD